MTEPWECPIEWQQATVGVEGVRQLVRAEVERFFAWWLDPKHFGGINDPRTVRDYFAIYLAARFPEAAPEPKMGETLHTCTMGPDCPNHQTYITPSAPAEGFICAAPGCRNVIPATDELCKEHCPCGDCVKLRAAPPSAAPAGIPDVERLQRVAGAPACKCLEQSGYLCKECVAAGDTRWPGNVTVTQCRTCKEWYIDQATHVCRCTACACEACKAKEAFVRVLAQAYFDAEANRVVLKHSDLFLAAKALLAKEGA